MGCSAAHRAGQNVGVSAAEQAERPWGRPDPAVAETRVAVRRALVGVREAAGEGSPLVLVALSGGADSLALAAAVAFEAPRVGVRAGAVVVDHGLQADSAAVADRAAAQARAVGLDPVVVRRVAVDDSSADGPEAAARAARYRALEAARAELGAASVLTAHTRDDQAEQVLLALARGSGTRAVAGIPPRRGRILRPFLGVSRATTERACAAQGLDPWHDPHNDDPAYARVRVRSTVLPLLERELGPGIAASLARTAELAREDAELLDELAAEAFAAVVRDETFATSAEPGETALDATVLEDVVLDVVALAALPAALRHRVIRLAAGERFGALLGREHTLAIAALATDWRGQGPIQAPGLDARRSGGSVILRATR